MALSHVATNILFGKNKKYGVGHIKFDLLLSETHNMESAVTDHPVEDGSIINDHIRNSLENGTLTGLISNFSIWSKPVVSDRVQDVYDALVTIWKERTLVTMYTMMGVYEDVAITNIPVTRDTDSVSSSVIQVVFKRVKVVKLQVVDLDTSIKVNDLKTAQNRSSASSKNMGRQNTTPPRNPQSTVTMPRMPVVTG